MEPDRPDTTPLVLVHGLWDTPRVFHPLLRALAGRRPRLLAPHLPHQLGRRSLTSLAAALNGHIRTAFGEEEPLDLLGFSMGGVVARTWLQQWGGARRTRRFLSVASPQTGTLTALPMPAALFAGLADMKPGSPLLRQLAAGSEQLVGVDCRSYSCTWDLMVMPGWQAVLPLGSRSRLPVLLHHRMIAAPAALERLVRDLLQEPP
ncbi:alpha/beta fold hydrolase [Synechococcus sp. RSCCF101]|nr:alpha/beta fold hydrolase [Synechococcus sp. RSCCF101]